ncbi:MULTISPECIES: EAL domain-containing protein [unclassified Bacillus (in: firmicutes)]|uniref:EAL domain-containing protein n=1 Tax=unclassified Bacillus (in: firmicutes) TaxID=185979 RepID=UPI0008E6FD44|nr:MULTISPECIES: EAL domain-containing protein [unclassified Bacillus (in: firmicutes)]SFA77570.1 EAL domain, c-di-GMP-specific phosphodiesterase class I (or its enzymatically inactive variant) [Bacillus sp. UNCCL13]SFQ67492.1 EAL domain, c-di-GMP-specific phosphodiesterase class I (or its enzymatically inactive variant) [Bacillus sp. cl95]
MNDYKCVQCGIPFQIYTNGYLFIETELNVTSDLFQNIGANCWVAPYEKLEYAEYLLKKLEESHLQFGREIRSALSQTKVKPLLFIPAESLLMQLQNAEIISTIQTGELISYLQPIIHLQENDRIFGYESLLRSSCADMISPGKLFSVAAKSGMLSLLDQRAREAAIIAKRTYVPKGVKSFINFLPSTIYNPEYCLRHTFKLVKKYEIDPSDLVFEVVETEKISDVDHLKRVLDTYKKQGMKVALDDVGSGFATLDVLQMLNPDFVKIDRHYVDHCDKFPEKQQFLTEVMQIAKDLGIIVLAEGIERPEELEHCRQIGIDLAQGFLIGRPSERPAKDIILI